MAASRNGRLVLSVSVAIQWSGLGPDLLLRLDRDSDQPLAAARNRSRAVLASANGISRLALPSPNGGMFP